MQAEKSVLGTLLKEPYLLAETRIQPEHLEQQQHRSILAAMKELKEQGKGVDVITLLSYYDPNRFGGANNLTDISNMANEKKFDDHERAVLDAFREREKKSIIRLAQTEDWSIEEITSKLDKLHNEEMSDFADIMTLTTEVYEAPYQKREIASGIDTGLKELNTMTGGFQNGELTIVAARPSTGKTDVMLHFSKYAGWNNALPIISSLEMSKNLLRDRLIASTGNYNRAKLKDPYSTMTDEQKKSWMPTLHRLSDTKMQIFDRSGQTLPEIRMKARKRIAEFPDRKPILFIDYLTLIRSTERTDNMHHKIGAISKGLKAIAKEFDCPVVVLAQLSRQVEQRQDKRPLLSDLRESGSIEEDADMVIMLYRDAYYTKDETNRTMELIIAKNRNGATGTVYAEYNHFTGSLKDQ
ncbi:MAG: DnaB-like helicase C-terminal domain-containing protein [Balneolales bacterium]